MTVRVAAFVLCASIVSAATPSADDSWATAAFTERGVDFGAVPRGAIMRHNFVLTNRTNEILNILDVRASCGCTTGHAQATTIPPGKSTIIEAQMDTRNFVGVKATKLTITFLSASGRQAETSLTVRSNILSDIVLNPGSFQFGSIARGQTAELALTIDRHGAPNWRIERMQATKTLSQFVEASLTETHRSNQGVGYMITVRARPNAPAGSIREEIRLVTNDQETPIVPVLVALEIRGGLTATPTLLALGQASTASGSVQGRILVRGNAPFQIESIEGAGDGFEITEAEPGTKPIHVLSVTFRPEQSATRGTLKRAFRVITNLPNEQPLDIQATVQVSP